MQIGDMGTGELLRFGEVEILVRATAASSGGAFALFEEKEPVDTPLHVHEHEDELFYVLDGEHEFQIGERIYRLRPGGPCSRHAGSRTRSGAWFRGQGECWS